MATFDSNLDGKANVGSGGGGLTNIENDGTPLAGGPFDTLNLIGGGAVDAGGGQVDYTPPGGGGPDTYTAPNEYYVDPSLSTDAAKRQYDTVAGALAAAVVAGDSPIVVRLADGQTHDWDGSSLPTTTDVYIYSTVQAKGIDFSGGTQLRFTGASPSILSEEIVSISNVSLQVVGGVEVGVDRLVLNNCSGAFNLVTTVPTPSGFGQTWHFFDCDMAMSVSPDATDTDGGQLTITNSRITNDFDTTLWDHSAGDEDWLLRFVQCMVTAVDVSTALFVGSGSFPNVGIGFQDTTMVVNNGSFDDQLVLSSGTYGQTWEASRIVEGVLDKGGGGFIFGPDQADQAGLLIEYSQGGGRLPLDAPDGTKARSQIRPSGFDGQGSWGEVTFNREAKQWRFPGNRVLFGLQDLDTNSDPTAFLTSIEQDASIDLNPSGSGSGGLFAVKGRLVADNFDANDGAIWDVDAVLRADITGTDDVDILSGSLPTLVWEQNPGQYTLQVAPAGEIRVQSVPVTGTLTINGNTLTAVAGPRTSGSDDFDGAATATEAIIGVNTSSDRFEIAGNFEGAVDVAGTITVSGSTGNDGVYTVDSVFFSTFSNETRINVVEPVPDPTADGSVTFARRPEEVARDIAEAINDPANSFAASTLARVNGNQPIQGSDVVAILSLSTSLDLGEASSQLIGDGLGIGFVLTRNSGTDDTHMSGEVQIFEGRLNS